MAISMFYFHYKVLSDVIFILCWFALQLSPKGDNNLPTEAEAEEKEMDTSKEDDLPSDKTSKEVRESFFLCHREHPNIMFIAVDLLQRHYNYYYCGSFRRCLIM